MKTNIILILIGLLFLINTVSSAQELLIDSLDNQKIEYNDLNNIEILYGNLVEVIDGKADVVVANILAEIVCILTDDVKRVLNEGGYFITSGIIHDRVELVTNKLEECGFQVLETNKDGEWNCIVAKLK